MFTNLIKQNFLTFKTNLNTQNISIKKVNYFLKNSQWQKKIIEYNIINSFSPNKHNHHQTKETNIPLTHK